MPADKTPRKLNPSRRGRRGGASAKFPGVCLFAREVNRSPNHVIRVLEGERVSRSLVKKFNEWLTTNKMPWPAAAKVKP